MDRPDKNDVHAMREYIRLLNEYTIRKSTEARVFSQCAMVASIAAIVLTVATFLM
jgi:hypothetical protein